MAYLLKERTEKQWMQILFLFTFHSPALNLLTLPFACGFKTKSFLLSLSSSSSSTTLVPSVDKTMYTPFFIYLRREKYVDCIFFTFCICLYPRAISSLLRKSQHWFFFFFIIKIIIIWKSSSYFSKRYLVFWKRTFYWKIKWFPYKSRYLSSIFERYVSFYFANSFA